MRLGSGRGRFPIFHSTGHVVLDEGCVAISGSCPAMSNRG